MTRRLRPRVRSAARGLGWLWLALLVAAAIVSVVPSSYAVVASAAAPHGVSAQVLDHYDRESPSASYAHAQEQSAPSTDPQCKNSGSTTSITSCAGTVSRFAAEAGGDAATTTGADQTPVVLGRNMAGRVIPYAKSVGADWYDGAPADVPPSQWLQHNADWLQEQMDNGRQVIDIGEDPASLRPSPNYDMEQQMLQGYSNYSRVFLDEPERYLMATAH